MNFINFIYNVMIMSLRLTLGTITLLAVVITAMYILIFGLNILNGIMIRVNEKLGINNKLDE